MRMGGVKLDSRSDVAAVTGRMAAALGYEGRVKMPPSGKLPADELALLREWLEAGAEWPSAAPAGPVARHWAFERVAKPAGGGSIDGFLDAARARRGLAVAGKAERRELIRRVTFDLHGLPPSAAETAEFVADARPDAWERLIDRLLASPRYGEKWGKHWLDLVRYGDTSGFEQDPYLLYAWRYRDYVIQSFNDDKPYDRFVKEQIAGDEIYPDDPAARQGTGYFTVGTNRDMLFKVEDTNRIETLTDFTDTTASVFLGLTMGCARCHDHKFDPLTQRDYYRFQAIFVPAVKTRVFLMYDQARVYDLGENTRTFRLYEAGAQLTALMDPYRKAIRQERLAKLPPEVAVAFDTPDEKKTPEQKALFEAHAKRVEPSDDDIFARFSKPELERLHRIERRLVSAFKSFAPGPFSPAVTDLSREAPRTFVPAKGGGLGEEVTAGIPAVFGGADMPVPPLTAETTHRRKGLAEWMASGENPLTARVWVNRVWQYHFGQGLVGAASDFGTRTAAPVHRQLLDWLAAGFMEGGWRTKALHKTILMSQAYQRGSRAPAGVAAADAENVYLSYFPRRRLEAEEIRDAVLQAAGTLNTKMGGRPVVPALAAEELYGMSQPVGNAWIVTEDAAEHNRRTVYMISRRNFRMPLLEVFDRPEGVLSCSRRESTTTAPQSLSLLNGGFTLGQAAALAERLEAAGDPVAAAWRSVYGREPAPDERTRVEAFLEKQTALLGSRRAALVELGRSLFNTNEFLYVE